MNWQVFFVVIGGVIAVAAWFLPIIWVVRNKDPNALWVSLVVGYFVASIAASLGITAGGGT